MIATKFCTWHDSWAVVTCAKFCCDMITSNWIRAKWNFHPNSWFQNICFSSPTKLHKYEISQSLISTLRIVLFIVYRYGMEMLGARFRICFVCDYNNHRSIGLSCYPLYAAEFCRVIHADLLPKLDWPFRNQNGQLWANNFQCETP